MLSVPQYLYQFTIHFIQQFKPSECNFPFMLKEARHMRQDHLSPIQASEYATELLEDYFRYAATPEGQEVEKRAEKREQRRYDNMNTISNWPRAELLSLIEDHTDIADLKPEQLLQWRKDLYSLI